MSSFPKLGKGIVKNINGLIRRFCRKKTDFATITSAEVRCMERILNSRPRERHRFKKWEKVFHLCITLIGRI